MEDLDADLEEPLKTNQRLDQTHRVRPPRDAGKNDVAFSEHVVKANGLGDPLQHPCDGRGPLHRYPPVTRSTQRFGSAISWVEGRAAGSRQTRLKPSIPA